MKLTAPFTVDQAQAAGDAWGFNCGPAALCAIFDLTPTQLRPALCDFESKRYTNPRMMRSILDWMNARYEWHVTRDYIGTFPALWPHNSLIRVQWDGPWCGPTRPAIARQRHTHWIACRHNGTHEPQVFDVNCTCGGWIYATEWEQQVVPWLLRQCEPQATGRWWQTHRAVVAEQDEMIAAYYNEFDPKAAAWLRELIKRGLIADGEVDTRSIVDVRATDLRGFTQCHFFAGIGGWSHALRLAGWTDDRPVWTGSCPCQPFSCAGAGMGEADERHLWPFFRNLIAECRPAKVFGEQVASKAALQWVDGVRADMERAGYAFGVADLCAAGVGAPHIRQRLYWMAVADDGRLTPRRGIEPEGAQPESRNRQPEQRSCPCAMAHSQHAIGRTQHIDRQDVGNGNDCGRPQAYGEPGACGEVRGMANLQGGRQRIDGSASRIAGHADQCGTAGRVGDSDGGNAGLGEQRLQPVGGTPVGVAVSDCDGSAARVSRSIARHEGDAKELDNGCRGSFSDNQQPAASSQQPAASSQQPAASSQQPAASRRIARMVYAQQPRLEGQPRHEHDRNESRWIIEDADRPTAAAGSDCFWSTSELIDCLDGKARRIEPGSFPLAHGVPARVVRLRGYGNAITPQAAAVFIETCDEVLTEKVCKS